MVRTAMDGFLMIDTCGGFLDANDAYVQMIGYSRSELLELGIQDVEAVESPEETAGHIRRIMRDCGDRFETRHIRKDGRIIDVEVSSNYLEAEGVFFSFVRDITDRKQRRQVLQEAHDALERQIQERAAGLQAANEQLQKEIYENAKAAKALQDSEEKFRSLVERSLDGIYITRGNRIVFASRTFLDMVNYTMEELRSISSWDLTLIRRKN